MFTKVLIANRGAIAVRIERTLKKMGVGSVAVYAQADQDSLHVKNADEAVCLGEGTVSETYLSIEKILAAAKETGAEAVHPGYGFLPENTDFAAACEQAGIRGYLGETLIGQKTCDSPDEAYGGFAYQKDFFAEYHGARHPRIHPIIAPHGTTTLSPEKLREAHELAVKYDTIFTLHASEMDYEMEHFRAMGVTPTAFLDSIGALDEHTLAAHCIHMTEEDLQLMKRRGAGIAHCICSNTKAGKGVAPMERARQLGVGFGLGTDGPSSGNTLSMFDQMRMLPNAQKTANHDRSLFPARTIVRAATRGGAEVLHGTDYGYLAPGMAADLTLVSTEAAHMFPVYNPFSALAYAANAADVDTVFANGRMVVRHGELTTLDLAEIRAQLVEKMKPFMAAAEKYSDII